MRPLDCNPFDWQSLHVPGEISVYLIRHGQTEWNKERRFLGRSDIPLDEIGRAQAVRLANAMADLPLNQIYSSPLSRAWQTAEALAEGRSCTIEAAEGLTELDQGDLEGRYGANLQNEFPRFYEQWRADPTHVRIPGGETLAECAERSVETFRELVRRHTSGSSIAIVAHRVSISAVLAEVIGLPVRYIMRIGQQNTAVNLLSHSPSGRTTLLRLNDAGHLTEAH